MNQTTNYQLNQWEPTDQVLRTDFNADNAKIEAALTGKLGRSEDILQVSVADSVSSFSIPFQDVDWNKWEAVAFTFDYRPYVVETDRFYCNLNGGNTTGYNTSGAGSFLSVKPYPFMLVFLPRHNGKNTVQAVSFGNTCGLHFGACTFAELTSLTVGYSSSHYKLSATTLTLWGIR